jgi:uroporphyrinogen-III decarboxylase
MTSRQRVLAAFRHEEPDRTPFFEKLIKSPVADEVLGRPCAASNWAYRMERLADGGWEGLMREEARDTVDLAKVLGQDLVRLYPNELPSAEKPKRIGADTWQIGGTIAERLPSGWIRHRPVEPPPPEDPGAAEQALRNSLDAENHPPRYSDEQLLVWRTVKEIDAEEGLDLAVFAAAYTMGAATLPAYLFEWFVRDREALHRYYERNAILGRDLGLIFAREGADIVALGGDLACDHGPMISPADYREFILPGIRLQSRAMHEIGAFTTNASDGNLWPILDDFLLGSEVDGFEEIDLAAGMDMARLKAHCGDRTTFIGNMDIRHLMTSGTVEQVREATFRCLDAGRPDGGHILMSGNCIHESVKTDLFLAYVAAYREFFGL